MAKMELWNFRSLEISFPGTFAPGSESSRNFRSQELLLQGATVATVPRTFAPRNFRSLELSPSGAKVPRTFAPTIFVHGYVCIRSCVPVFTVRRYALHSLSYRNSVRLSVCLSVLLSHSWTVSTWFDLRS